MFFDLTQLSVYFRYLDFGKEKRQGGREKEGGKRERERDRGREKESRGVWRGRKCKVLPKKVLSGGVIWKTTSVFVSSIFYRVYLRQRVSEIPVVVHLA